MWREKHFQFRDGGLGGFNVVTWDFDQNKHKLSQFTWTNIHFALKEESEWLEDPSGEQGSAALLV